MVGRFLNVAFWSVLLTAFVVTGCEEGFREEQVTYHRVIDPNLLIDPNSVIPDYVSKAIAASGGGRVWTKVERLDFDCVVTFYQQDDSFYITEQRHEIHPWSDYIRISAREPQGKFVWQLSRGQFSILKGDQNATTSPVKGCDRQFAEVILNITTAPVRLLDKSAVLIKRPKPVKIEGLWYDPIEWVNGDDRVETFWSQIVFYQNKDSSLVDMLWFANVNQEKFLAVRGYDYDKVGKIGILAPTKIEVFKTDRRGTLQGLLAKIEYYGLVSTE